MKFILKIIVIAIAIVAFFIFVMPEYKEVNSLKSVVAEYDNALDNAKELQQKRDEILESYNSISKANKDRLESLLPDIDDGTSTSGSIALILEIDKIANSHGIRITDVYIEESGKENLNTISSNNIDANTDKSKDIIQKDYITSVLSFKLQASYQEFIAFVNDLEKNLRIIDMKKIAFSVPKSTRENPNINPNLFEYSFELQSYWLNK